MNPSAPSIGSVVSGEDAEEEEEEYQGETSWCYRPDTSVQSGQVISGEDAEEEEEDDSINTTTTSTTTSSSLSTAADSYDRDGEGERDKDREGESSDEEGLAGSSVSTSTTVTALDSSSGSPPSQKNAKESTLVRDLRWKSGKFKQTLERGLSSQLWYAEKQLASASTSFDKSLYAVKDVSYNVRLANVDLEELFTNMTEALTPLQHFKVAGHSHAHTHDDVEHEEADHELP